MGRAQAEGARGFAQGESCRALLGEGKVWTACKFQGCRVVDVANQSTWEVEERFKTVLLTCGRGGGKQIWGKPRRGPSAGASGRSISLSVEWSHSCCRTHRPYIIGDSGGRCRRLRRFRRCSTAVHARRFETAMSSLFGGGRNKKGRG